MESETTRAFKSPVLHGLVLFLSVGFILVALGEPNGALMMNHTDGATSSLVTRFQREQPPSQMKNLAQSVVQVQALADISRMKMRSMESQSNYAWTGARLIALCWVLGVVVIAARRNIKVQMIFFGVILWQLHSAHAQPGRDCYTCNFDISHHGSASLSPVGNPVLAKQFKNQIGISRRQSFRMRYDVTRYRKFSPCRVFGKLRIGMIPYEDTGADQNLLVSDKGEVDVFFLAPNDGSDGTTVSWYRSFGIFRDVGEFYEKCYTGRTVVYFEWNRYLYNPNAQVASGAPVKPACFPLGTQVHASSSKVVGISSLKLGSPVWDAVSRTQDEIFFPAFREDETSGQFVHIETVMHKKSVMATPNHIIPILNMGKRECARCVYDNGCEWKEERIRSCVNHTIFGSLMKSSDERIWIWVVHNDTGALVIDEIDGNRTRVVYTTGMFAPLSLKGYLVVNGILAHSLGRWKLDAWIKDEDWVVRWYNTIFAWFRWEFTHVKCLYIGGKQLEKMYPNGWLSNDHSVTALIWSYVKLHWVYRQILVDQFFAWMSFSPSATYVLDCSKF